MRQKTPEFEKTYYPLVSSQKGGKEISEFDATYDPIVSSQKWGKKTPEFDTTHDPIVSVKSEAKKLQNLTHVESTLVLENLPNLWQNMSLYIIIDPIAITCWINFGARKFTKFMAKVRFSNGCTHDFQI